MATRWGIASAGKISHDFAMALDTLPEGEHIIVGVAARDLSRAQEFAKVHNARKAYGSYRDLAEDNEIEVVYIGALNPQHLEIAKLMLSHGKHVLCEKPLTLNLKQTTELINFAKEKGLFLMEAIWSRCFPTYDWIRKITESDLGDVKQVIANLGFNVIGMDRLSQKDLGGGTILDLGVYTIQFVLWVFNGEKPTSIKASGFVNENGVDKSMSATLLFKNGRTATILIHSEVNLPSDAVISGTKGTLKVPQFRCPTQIVEPSGNVRSITLPEPRIPAKYDTTVGLRFEAAEVRRCLLAGLKESPLVSHKDSLLISEIQDELRKQLGVVFAED